MVFTKSVMEVYRFNYCFVTKGAFFPVIWPFLTVMRKISVLFVCLGNICRSPLAEAIFKHKIKARGLENIVVADSCGTSNYHIGSQPDSRTLANATRNGIMVEHCCRQLDADDLKNFDHILAMDRSNFQNIMRLPGSERYKDKVKMMRDFDALHRGADVPDPYHGGDEGFQEVFEILNRSIDEFIDSLALSEQR